MKVNKHKCMTSVSNVSKQDAIVETSNNREAARSRKLISTYIVSFKSLDTVSSVNNYSCKYPSRIEYAISLFDCEKRASEIHENAKYTGGHAKIRPGHFRKFRNFFTLPSRLCLCLFNNTFNSLSIFFNSLVKKNG